MPLKFLYCVLAMAVSLVGCKSPEARRPVQQSSGSTISASVERNKKLYAAETKTIEAYMAPPSGFWYAYDTQILEEQPKPVTGNEVSFTYQIRDLEGQILLSYEDIGSVNYQVDQSQQDLISGIREGLKLMKVQEMITLVLPSYKAYGYYGLEGKLGANVPVVVTLNLKQMSTLDN
jgi:gliding motility-associated peptidyl-prolyl isomerase